MKLYSVFDKEFREYGCVTEGFDCGELLEVLRQRECPSDHVIYVPSDAQMEALDVIKKLQDHACGKIPMQVGYTNGSCTKMNALEYHKSSEWNVSDEDIILFLARRQDLSEEYEMNTDKVKAFLLPKGVLVEVYATTLHYAPCCEEGKSYRCIVVLPRGTNIPAEKGEIQNMEDRLMTAANKWLIGHPDGGCDEGTWLGLTGPNWEIKNLE